MNLWISLWVMSTLHVNIPESLRRRAESLTQDDGVSLDQFIATALAKLRTSSRHQ